MFLILREHVPDAAYLRYGGEPLESASLLIDLPERAGKEGAVDTRMPGAFYQLVFPDYRLGALRWRCSMFRSNRTLSAPQRERPEAQTAKLMRKTRDAWWSSREALSRRPRRLLSRPIRNRAEQHDKRRQETEGSRCCDGKAHGADKAKL